MEFQVLELNLLVVLVDQVAELMDILQLEFQEAQVILLQ